MEWVIDWIRDECVTWRFKLALWLLAPIYPYICIHTRGNRDAEEVCAVLLADSEETLDKFSK